MKISSEEEEKEEEEDEKIRRQDEVFVGERIELHSLGLSALSLIWFTGERQVRLWVTGCSFKTAFTSSQPIRSTRAHVQEFECPGVLQRRHVHHSLL